MGCIEKDQQIATLQAEVESLRNDRQIAMAKWADCKAEAERLNKAISFMAIELDTADCLRKDVCRQRDSLQQENARLQQRIATLEGLLEKLEWEGSEYDDGSWYPGCLVCKGIQPGFCGTPLRENHKPDCELAAALAAGRRGER